ncbi:MAG: hypothetical protein LBM93_12340, partial [Oscillospiraceae bacterium]|nr:hypothetical protein [Oscillospiraceae bacterium]
ASRVIKVNPNNKKYDVIDLDFVTKTTERFFLIIGVEEIGDKLYFIDYYSENSFCIDKNTEKITKAEIFNKGLKISCVKKHNGNLYCSYFEKNAIIEFDGVKFTEIPLMINGNEFSEKYDFLTVTLNTPKTNYGEEIYKFLRNK